MGPSDAAMTPGTQSERGDLRDATATLMPLSKVRVRVVGAAEISVGRMQIGTDAAVLFALVLYLSARAGTKVSRAELLEMIWTELPERGSKHALRQLAYRLRKAGLELGDGDTVSIDAESIESDLNALLTERWVAECQISEIPRPSTVLAGVNATVSAPFSDWLESTRQEANRNARRAALRHIARCRREGRWLEVEKLARICLASDPLNEEATLALAEATAMSGGKAEALRILDAYLWELGDKAKEIGLPAKLLQRRISDQPQSRIPRSGEVPLIGRSKELAWLNDRIEEAVSGGPRAALIVGPPGIGKTAVIRALTSQIVMRGWRVGDARLQPSDVSRPMSLFIELLPALLKMEGAMGAAPESLAVINQLTQHDESRTIDQMQLTDAPAFPARVQLATVDLISAIAEEGPLAIVLEDLHWIDARSLAALGWLLERIGNAHVCVLLTSRPEAQHAELQGLLRREMCSQASLDALSADHSEELFRSLTARDDSRSTDSRDDVDFALTGGNPLFIRTIADAWVHGRRGEQLTGSLRELIHARVSGFSAGAQRVLNACAMLGRYATAERVTRVLEMPTGELLACVEEIDSLGLLGLVGEPGSLALHDLWQEELLAKQRQASRTLLHLRCGEVLAHDAGPNGPVGLVHDAARHLVAGGAASRATRLLLDSARHLLATGLTEGAVEASRTALGSASTDSERAEATDVHLRALFAVGDLRAVVELDPQLTTAILSGDGAPGVHGEIEELIIEATWRAGLGVEQPLTAALNRAEDTNATFEQRAAACLLAGQMSANMLDYQSMTHALGALRRLPTTSSTACATFLAAQVVLEAEVGSIDLALRVATQLVEHERRSGTIMGRLRALKFAAHAHRAHGQWEAALSACREAHDIATRHQLREIAGQVACIAGTISRSLGNLTDAAHWVECAEVAASRTTVEYLPRMVQTLRAEVALAYGRIELAETMLAALQATNSRVSLRDGLEVLTLAVKVAAQAGDAARLREAVILLGDRLKEPPRERLRHDEYAGTYVLGLRALGATAQAEAFRSEYVTSRRRDVAPLPEALRPSGSTSQLPQVHLATRRT